MSVARTDHEKPNPLRSGLDEAPRGRCRHRLHRRRPSLPMFLRDRHGGLRPVNPPGLPAVRVDGDRVVSGRWRVCRCSQRMYEARQFTMAEIAASCDVTAMTIYRNIRTSEPKTTVN